jgi:hypothetical protein
MEVSDNVPKQDNWCHHQIYLQLVVHSQVCRFPVSPVVATQHRHLLQIQNDICFKLWQIPYLRHCLLKCQSKTVQCCTNALHDYALDRCYESGKILSRELVHFWWLKCKTITILQSLDKNPWRKIKTGRYHHRQNAARHLLMISSPVIKISP